MLKSIQGERLLLREPMRLRPWCLGVLEKKQGSPSSCSTVAGSTAIRVAVHEGDALVAVACGTALEAVYEGAALVAVTCGTAISTVHAEGIVACGTAREAVHEGDALVAVAVHEESIVAGGTAIRVAVHEGDALGAVHERDTLAVVT